MLGDFYMGTDCVVLSGQSMSCVRISQKVSPLLLNSTLKNTSVIIQNDRLQGRSHSSYDSSKYHQTFGVMELGCVCYMKLL